MGHFRHSKAAAALFPSRHKVEEVMNAVYAKDSGRKAQVYAFDKNSYRLPIPQSVIDANDKIQQNPGY